MWKYRRSRQSIHRERSQPEIWKRERREGGFRPGSPLSRLRHAEKSVHNTGPALSSAKGKARVGGVNRIENSRPVSDSSSSTVTHPPIESSPVKSRTNLRKVSSRLLRETRDDFRYLLPFSSISQLREESVRIFHAAFVRFFPPRCLQDRRSARFGSQLRLCFIGAVIGNYEEKLLKAFLYIFLRRVDMCLSITIYECFVAIFENTFTRVK